MKKASLILLVLLSVSSLAFAADKAAAKPAAKAAPAKAASSSSMVPNIDKGSFTADLGIGYGGLSGGVEYQFARFDIANIVPVTIGAGARAVVDPGIFNSSFSTFSLGVGGLVTSHWEYLAPSAPDWVKKLDFGFGLGVGFATATPAAYYSSYTVTPGIGLATFESLSYFISKNLAVTFEYGYCGAANFKWNSTYYNYTYPVPVSYETIGVTYKF
jgi:hypothetical protein